MAISSHVSLDSIIKNKSLTVCFQPIAAYEQASIFAYEALIRGPINTPLHSPIALFEEATNQGRLIELELLCRALSIQQFQLLKLPGKLFLNASADTLFQPDFRAGETLKMLHSANLSPRRVVLELTEHSPLEDYVRIREAVNYYKDQGFEIAMDDLGAGYSGLRMWHELRPDYVKIDRHFIANIDNDKVKQQFVLSIRNIARELNCKVIAEGVETEQEFTFIEGIGLPFCQGFYIAKPTPSPQVAIDKSLFLSAQKLGQPIKGSSPAVVAELLQEIPAISELSTVEYSAKLFRDNPEWESIPVVEFSASGKQRPLGLIRRSCLTQLLFTKFGRELSGKKSISAHIERNVLMVESQLAIEQAGQIIGGQFQTQKALEFIIVEDGVYQGVGSIMALIKMMSHVQISNARHANPLTLLPGNVPINTTITQFIEAQSAFVIAYIDLDNFKPYNDYYGYEKGDKIISGLAGILKEVMSEQDFIGHIGGDDFIFISANKQWEKLFNEIIKQFSEWVRHQYQPEDQMMGGISAKDRFGESQFYPMLSLSIGCIELLPPVCKSYHEVAALASHAKSMAKKQNGNTIYIADEAKSDGIRQLSRDIVEVANAERHYSITHNQMMSVMH